MQMEMVYIMEMNKFCKWLSIIILIIATGITFYYWLKFDEKKYKEYDGTNEIYVKINQGYINQELKTAEEQNIIGKKQTDIIIEANRKKEWSVLEMVVVYNAFSKILSDIREGYVDAFGNIMYEDDIGYYYDDEADEYYEEDIRSEKMELEFILKELKNASDKTKGFSYITLIFAILLSVSIFVTLFTHILGTKNAGWIISILYLFFIVFGQIISQYFESLIEGESLSDIYWDLFRYQVVVKVSDWFVLAALLMLLSSILWSIYYHSIKNEERMTIFGLLTGRKGETVKKVVNVTGAGKEDVEYKNIFFDEPKIKHSMETDTKINGEIGGGKPELKVRMGSDKKSTDDDSEGYTMNSEFKKPDI